MEQAEAGIAFDFARELLQPRIGNSLKDEYLRLNQALHVTWENLQSAGTALDRHIREHGCQEAGG